MCFFLPQFKKCSNNCRLTLSPEILLNSCTDSYTVLVVLSSFLVFLYSHLCQMQIETLYFCLTQCLHLREQGGRKYLSCGRKNQAQILPPLVRMRKELGTKATSSLGAFRILLRREICQKTNLKTSFLTGFLSRS